MKENLPPKIHQVFSRWGGGGKNAKFHHLNLLGAALRNRVKSIAESDVSKRVERKRWHELGTFEGYMLA